MTLGTFLTEFVGLHKNHMTRDMLQSNPRHPCQRETKPKPNQLHSVWFHPLNLGKLQTKNGSSRRLLRRRAPQRNGNTKAGSTRCWQHQCRRHQRSRQCQHHPSQHDHRQRWRQLPLRTTLCRRKQSVPQASWPNSKTFKIKWNKALSVLMTS